MKCPVCTTTDLLMTERQGVEIDYCPQCRGVWLDRGELDKVIERSAAVTPQQPPASQQPPQRVPEYHTAHARQDHDRHYDRKHHGSVGYGQHKKKSLLQELFDFD